MWSQSQGSGLRAEGSELPRATKEFAPRASNSGSRLRVWSSSLKPQSSSLKPQGWLNLPHRNSPSRNGQVVENRWETSPTPCHRGCFPYGKEKKKCIGSCQPSYDLLSIPFSSCQSLWTLVNPFEPWSILLNPGQSLWALVNPFEALVNPLKLLSILLKLLSIPLNSCQSFSTLVNPF